MSSVIDPDGRRGPVLAVCGFAREARIAGGPEVETIQAGGDPDRLRRALHERSGPEPRAVISFGIAGGLDPDLRPGDIVVASGIVIGDRRLVCDARLARSYAHRLAPLGIRKADLVGVDAAVTAPSDKAEWHRRTGAAAVDMESHVAAAYAQERSVPFCALRVVCDPAAKALPAFAAKALKPNGDPDILAVLAALLRREAKIAELIGLARDSGKAFAGLSRARALLGLALGVDA